MKRSGAKITMKKNIWSNVYYRLNDPVKIRLAILYVIKYADLPISSMELKHVMLQATSVDYIDLCEIIDFLKNENYIKTVRRDEKDKYELTSSGLEMINMFETDILSSVKASIKKSVDEYFKEQFRKSQVRSEISPNDGNTYYLDVELNEGNTRIFSMSVFAGSRQKVLQMRRQFNADPMGLYKEILKLLYENQETENEQ